jgi:hypothetical protein
MKKWIRFECGDIICAKVKKLNNREYRVTTDHGWLFVSWNRVFDTQQQAKLNCQRASLADYVQVFRKPITMKPWYVDTLNGPTKKLKRKLPPSDLCDFLTVLEPEKSPFIP